MKVSDKVICTLSLLDPAKSKILANLTRSLRYDTASYKALLSNLEKEFGGETLQCETSYQKIFDNSNPNWSSAAWVQDFKTSLISYGNVLDTYGRRATEFARNGQLYKKLLAEKFDRQRRLDFQTEQLSSCLLYTSPSPRDS